MEKRAFFSVIKNYQLDFLSVSELTEEEEIELIRVRELERQESFAERERVRQTIRLNRRQAAMMMLLSIRAKWDLM